MSETALLGKLHEVAVAISYIEKHGENQHHKYNFVQAVDVVKRVRDELLGRGVVVIPASSNARHLAYGSKGAHLTTVDLAYRFRDVETGACIEVPWVGVGSDTGGDKGIYKAYTGGLKYALLGLFLIPTSDDPERDELTQRHEPEDAKTHKDDDRPAAPRIPLDRAQLILDQAVGVDMAAKQDDGSVLLHAVLQAVLEQQGVRKIGELNVDQAEAVEAFLAEEAKGE